jgi:hypothetical protein
MAFNVCDLKKGQMVEIKNLLYFGDAWNNFNGYGTILRIYPKVNKIDVSFINNFNKCHKYGVDITDIIQITSHFPMEAWTMQASPKHLSALTPISEGMEEKAKVPPFRATVTFESEAMQKRVQLYTATKMGNLREQSKAINHLIDVAMKLEGF